MRTRTLVSMVINGPSALVFAKVMSPASLMVAPDLAERVRVFPLGTVKALMVTDEQSDRSEASSTLATVQDEDRAWPFQQESR